jgi:hypothetical protein
MILKNSMKPALFHLFHLISKYKRAWVKVLPKHHGLSQGHLGKPIVEFRWNRWNTIEIIGNFDFARWNTGGTWCGITLILLR